MQAINPEDDLLRPRDPEDRPIPQQDERAHREKMLDKTLADSFPTSDPPSSLPDPSAADSLQPVGVDPVCERPIDPEMSAIKVDYEGKTYNFCSEECKERFQVYPGPYSKEA